SGWLLWIAALGGGARPDRARIAAGALALLLTATHMALLGVLFATSTRVLYPHAGATAHALEEQQLGGVLMLAIGGVAYLLDGLPRARVRFAVGGGSRRVGVRRGRFRGDRGGPGALADDPGGAGVREAALGAHAVVRSRRPCEPVARRTGDAAEGGRALRQWMHALPWRTRRRTSAGAARDAAGTAAAGAPACAAPVVARGTVLDREARHQVHRDAALGGAQPRRRGLGDGRVPGAPAGPVAGRLPAPGLRRTGCRAGGLRGLPWQRRSGRRRVPEAGRAGCGIPAREPCGVRQRQAAQRRDAADRGGAGRRTDRRAGAAL